MSYLNLFHNNELMSKVDLLLERLDPCSLCPRECGARRLHGERGECGAGEQAEISGYGPHFGEEAPLVGQGGSGTIFFAFCSLRCVFCQNYEISRGKDKYPVTNEELVDIMVKLQEMGCVNINLVTPTHYVPQILEALQEACHRGLKLPLVYNCSGFEKLETLRLLQGVINIYLPDIKYANSEIARKYSHISDYAQIAKATLQEMHRQVGDLVIDQRGVAQKGLLIRHLVMPEGIAGTAELMQFIAKDVSPRSWINIMDQYYPTYLAHRYREVARRVTEREFKEAIEAANESSSEFHLL